MEQRSEDIIAVMDAVGSERAALLGASEGGAICSVFAATYPERVTHLILNGSKPKYTWSPDYPYGADPDGVEAQISELVENWGGSMPLDTGAPSVADDPAACELRYRGLASLRSIPKHHAVTDDAHHSPEVRLAKMHPLILKFKQNGFGR